MLPGLVYPGISADTLWDIDRMVARTKAGSGRGSFAGLVVSAAADLFPGYFALVMATGMLCVACSFLGYPWLAHLLAGFNWVAYAAILVLTFVRAFVFPSRMIEDLGDHGRAPGYFTLVAGTCVLGTQSVLVSGATSVGMVLWYFGLGLWLVIMYAVLTAVIVRERKPTFGAGVHGGWLIAVVATQAIVVLRGVLDDRAPPPDELQLLCLGLFMIGCMLYLAIIPLIFYRLAFVPLAPHQFSPPYWINMGAVAITALAGSTLVMRADQWSLLESFLPFLQGITVFFWACATWWIPVLLMLMIWRYGLRRDRFAYEPQFWAMVFPLAMYAVSTYEFSRTFGFTFLMALAKVFLYLALAAWLWIFAAMVMRLWVSARAYVKAGRLSMEPPLD